MGGNLTKRRPVEGRFQSQASDAVNWPVSCMRMLCNMTNNNMAFFYDSLRTLERGSGKELGRSLR